MRGIVVEEMGNNGSGGGGGWDSGCLLFPYPFHACIESPCRLLTSRNP